MVISKIKSQEYQAYYTKSEPILEYMTSILNIKSSDSVLEPCGGDGVFIDKIIEDIPNANITIYELNPDSAQYLRNKYSKNNFKIIETDTLLDDDIVNGTVLYDKIIGNPPYGAKINSDKKNTLQNIYSNLYIKESYTLFLYACIRCLKEGGALSFIVPDTFLSLHRHQYLREFILKETKIVELSLFPSSFFPGVNFGYANLCIITLKRNSNITSNMSNEIRIRTDFPSVECLPVWDKCKIKTIRQSVIYNNVGCAFMTDADPLILELINNRNFMKIGDIANCVTGFYSGNDKEFLHPINKDVKNANRYELVNPDNIHKGRLSEEDKINGIRGLQFMVPIVKGGNISFYKPDYWFMDWSVNAISKYRISTKCRFQNPKFYFRNGIAIPMVRSSRLSASLIEEKLFDQSIVGVFPHEEKYIYYLLGLFNTEFCTRIINAINPSANNSANYIKKIPFIVPSEVELNEVNEIVINIINTLKIGLKPKQFTTDKLEFLISKIYRNSYNSILEEISGNKKQKMNYCQLSIPFL